MSNYNAERQRAIRAQRRAEGICTDCGKQPAFGRFVRCAECIYKASMRKARQMTREAMDRENERNRRHYHEDVREGRCPVCRRVNPVPEYKTCPECRRKGRNYYRQHYNPHTRPEGMCPRCDRPSRPGAKLCDVHYAKAVEAGRKGLMAQNRARHPWRLIENMRRMKAMDRIQCP